MPALPDVPGVLKCEFLWGIGDDVAALSRIFLAYSGVAPSNGDLITLSDVAVTTFTTDVAALFADSNALLNVVLTDLSSPTGAIGESTTGPVVGTRGATPLLPGATSVLFNYHLGRRYRGGHPRSYVPMGLASDLTTEQRWASTPLGDFLTGWEDLFAFYTGSVWAGGGTIENVNVSYFEGFTPVQNPITLRWRNVPKVRPTPLVDVVAAVEANPAPAFQSRRGLIP